MLAASRGLNIKVARSDIEVMGDREGLARCLGHLLGAAMYVAAGPIRARTYTKTLTSGDRCARVELDVTRAELDPGDLQDLGDGKVDATILDKGPEAFGLSLFLAARYALVMRAGIEIVRGVTHQIRAHMQNAGYPIAGDPLYGGRRRDPFGLGRQFLHARAIELLDQIRERAQARRVGAL